MPDSLHVTQYEVRGDILWALTSEEATGATWGPVAPVRELLAAAAERDAIATLLSDRFEAGTYAKVEGLRADQERHINRANHEIARREQVRIYASRCEAATTRMALERDAEKLRAEATEARIVTLMTDADLRARADQVNAWLVSLENGPIDLHRVLDAQELMHDLLAVVDQLQTLLAKLEYMEPEKFAAWRARAETLRAEAAEARLQALQPYLQHLPTCATRKPHVYEAGFAGFVDEEGDLQTRSTRKCISGPSLCDCGFATLPQPGTPLRNEWRLDCTGALDDVVVDKPECFRLERMADDHVWGAVYYRDGSRTTFDLFGERLSLTHESEPATLTQPDAAGQESNK